MFISLVRRTYCSAFLKETFLLPLSWICIYPVPFQIKFDKDDSLEEATFRVWKSKACTVSIHLRFFLHNLRFFTSFEPEVDTYKNVIISLNQDFKKSSKHRFVYVGSVTEQIVSFWDVATESFPFSAFEMKRSVTKIEKGKKWGVSGHKLQRVNWINQIEGWSLYSDVVFVFW